VTAYHIELEKAGLIIRVARQMHRYISTRRRRLTAWFPRQ
jgi:ribosomal protein L13E